MNPTTSNARPAHVLIDAAALRYNLQRVRELCADVAIMAVIKADGYGHGMELVAEALSDVDELGVNSMDDVHRLRAHGITTRCCLLSASFDLKQLSQMQALDVRPVVYDQVQIALLEQLDEQHRVSIWLKVDTGMGRLGILPEELDAVVARLDRAGGVRDISLMTHFANADRLNHPGTALQESLFNDLALKFDYTELSIANSAGIVAQAGVLHRVPPHRVPPHRVPPHRVRPGIMLYGISPVVDKSAEQLGLQPAMTFNSQLISVRHLSSGSALGYGSTHVLEQDSRIGVVACGYGDGYPRHAPSGTPVLVNGKIVPLVGRVSMDMITVALGDLPAAVGDPVTLWGVGNPIETVATAAGTIAYELCCGILPRVERIAV